MSRYCRINQVAEYFAISVRTVSTTEPTPSSSRAEAIGRHGRSQINPKTPVRLININDLGPGTLAGMQVQVIDPAGDVLIAGSMMGLSTAVPGIDLSSATRDLTINAMLVQAGDTVYNVGADRNLSLLGSILGSGNLVKRGDGTVTLSNANAYTGSALIQGGDSGHNRQRFSWGEQNRCFTGCATPCPEYDQPFVSSC